MRDSSLRDKLPLYISQMPISVITHKIYSIVYAKIQMGKAQFNIDK